jgi:hypothetical protein
MNSGPERKEKLTYEAIRRVIDELRRSSPLRLVIFAGGEPTLLKNDLLDAIAYCDAMGILTRVVTNVSWATTFDTARKILVSMREAGLREVNFSADDYHLPYIPFERVGHAWRASKGLGFDSVSIANCYGPLSLVTPDYIQKQLGEEIPCRWDSKGMALPMPKPAPDGTLYILSNAKVLPLGRGRQTIKVQEYFVEKNQKRLDMPCPWAIKSAALSAEGHLVACCGTEAHGNAVLDFGSTLQHDTNALVRRANDDLVVNAIAYLGPAFVMKFIKEHEPSVPFKPAYGGICEICEDVVHRQPSLDALNKHLHQLAPIVLRAKTLVESSQGKESELSEHDPQDAMAGM